jgi:large subunit ribosomal protein L29
MKTSDIRLMSIEEIQTKITDSRNDLMNLRFQVVSGQLTDTSKLKTAKKEIARYETIMQEKMKERKMEGEA